MLARNKTEIFWIFFLAFISLLSFTVYLVRFNTSNKRHVPTYMLKSVSISTFPSLNISIFTEEDDKFQRF